MSSRRVPVAAAVLVALLSAASAFAQQAPLRSAINECKKGEGLIKAQKWDEAIAALNAVANEGGKAAFVVVLVDREEGGRQKIEATGCPVFSLFKRDELLSEAG